MSYPIELAEYAVLSHIAKEPAFTWWVPHSLHTHRTMVSKIETKYWQTTHMFGIELPKNVKDAFEIDRKTGTDFWCQAIEKELKKIHETMQKFDGTCEDAKKKLISYQEIWCHMICDVKREGLLQAAT
jgi:hypothetical protein